jgi:flagellar basal body-associated protein FliL
MSTTPTPPVEPGSNRRLLVIIVALVVIALVIGGLVAAYWFLFGSEAPPAPTIVDAIKILLPSASPE